MKKRISLEKDPYALLARDLNRGAVQAALRREIWAILRQIGLVAEKEPPTPKDPPRSVIQEALIRAGLLPSRRKPPGGESG
jgi:hypothetical protein